MGTITPWAPASSALLIIHSSPHGTRMIGLAPSEATAVVSYERLFSYQHDTVNQRLDDKRSRHWATHLVVVMVCNQTMLGINQHPGKPPIWRQGGRPKKMSCNSGRGQAVSPFKMPSSQSMSPRGGRKEISRGGESSDQENSREPKPKRRGLLLEGRTQGCDKRHSNYLL